MAELLLNPEDRRTKTDKMKEVGVPRRTFYKWMKDRRYVDYINSQLDQYTNTELPDIWKALIRQAIRGNTQAIKLFFEMKGLYTERKELTGRGGGAIEVNSTNEQNYNITQTIIAQNPSLIDEIFGRRVEDRGGKG